MKNIPFILSEYHNSYTSQAEGLNIIETKDIVIINICQAFPTPGYSMGIDKIEKEGETFYIYLDIIPPKPDAILLQVITYGRISIEIDKKNLGEPPYKFKVVGGPFREAIVKKWTRGGLPKQY